MSNGQRICISAEGIRSPHARPVAIEMWTCQTHRRARGGPIPLPTLIEKSR